MCARRQQNEERSILDAVASVAPTFFEGINFALAEPDPPDFIGESITGLRIGLELTSWLNNQQTRDAQNELRRKLLFPQTQRRNTDGAAVPTKCFEKSLQNHKRFVPMRRHCKYNTNNPEGR
jgi:hypothetical protein